MTLFREGHVYRLMPPQTWTITLASSFIPYNADDERDGFFHLSAPGQVLATAEKHYAEHDLLVAAGMPEAALEGDLKWEQAPNGAIFPHYYGFAPSDAVAHTLELRRDGPNGAFQVIGAYGG